MKALYLILITTLLLTACSPAASILSTATPQPTITSLPQPTVVTTHAPSAESAAISFLDAWKAEDYPKMYSLLTSISKDAITVDDFDKKYRETAISLTLQSLEYTILSTLTNPTNAQVAFRVTYKTVLLGDISRDISMNMDMEKGYWLVQWEEGLILPELKGGNHLSLDVKIPARGAIYDRDGHAIAAQADAVSLGVVPARILPDNENNLLLVLSRLTGLPYQWIRAKYSGTENYYIMVGETTKDRYNEYSQTLAASSGVEVSQYNTRYYFDGGISPQVTGYVQLVSAEDLETYKRIGYLGDEKVGISGLEGKGEEILAGKHGGNLYVIDPNGQIVTRMASAEPSAAQSIYTTLDSDLQVNVQKDLAGFSGSAIVMERDTGRILAMASAPDYDPNLFDPNNVNFQFLNQNLSGDNPLLNRASQGQYPLGSVFKIISMTAALESKQFTYDQKYECGHEFTELPGWTGYDWTYAKGYNPSGTLTLQEGLMRSCNPYFWHIGLDLFNKGLGKEIPIIARGFGLGSPTGLEWVEEEAGNVEDPTEAMDSVQMAIGQGTLLVTPLQVVNFVAAIGNGGTLHTPQIIEKIAPPDADPTFTFAPVEKGKLPITAENLKYVQEAMRMVVAAPRGTAHHTFSGLGIPVYGKTGTAQTGDSKPHAWFAGYTDAQNAAIPDVAVVVMLEYQGEGSDWAAPIFRRIVEQYFYGQASRVYPWETTYYVTNTPTPFGFEATPTKTPKKKSN
jgi:cell division protein FtsI/penicillin-binding protein 2